ncbi:UDP-2,4-diacetamido-2,4,6-trideoxy-beta-L-altropyranose hydrolase [Metabacillus herbersteinensis]|uniref:UDP-2,4-diacetamido-2,4, 6-trideoxy-beta-L-altropyranose hydrolase n=1 Tax=Metabacillus herbersteinensis TaxID=283816 RepID=A0ABV6GE17_9BACI
MNIVFRVDASIRIGTGHVMRCLTLADHLQKEGAQITFVCREWKGNLNNFIESKKFHVIRLSNQIDHFDQEIDANETLQNLKELREQVDLLIIDHYQIDITWEQQVKNAVRKLMAIDDLANRQHYCDLLLDQNYDHDYRTRYDQFVPVHCRKLLGPQYLILRPEFIEARRHLKTRDGVVRRMLVFFGGSDPENITEKALAALKHIGFSSIHLDVVVGETNPNCEKIKQMCKEMKCYFHFQIDYLARLLSKADLVLGAGGIMMWERCYLGVPSITVMVATNQIKPVKAASSYGAIWNLGWHQDVEVSDFIDKVNAALSSTDELKQMNQRAMKLMNSQIIKQEQKNKVVEAILDMK